MNAEVMQYAVSKWEKERVRESENLRQGRGCCRPSSVSNWEKIRVKESQNLMLGRGYWGPSSVSN